MIFIFLENVRRCLKDREVTGSQGFLRSLCCKPPTKKKCIMQESSFEFRSPWGWIILTLMFGCQNNENSLTPEQSKLRTEVAAEDNSQILAMTQEVLDITSVALVEKGVAGGRRSSGSRINSHDQECFPTISASYDVKKSSDSLVYTGVLTVDFGDGSSCQDSANVRLGKITDAFKYTIAYKDSIPFKAEETITFDQFVKDSVQLDGTFISSFTSDGSYTLDISNAVLAYNDGTSTQWSGMLVYHHDDGGSPWNATDDTRTLTGSIGGNTRDGVSFTSEITNAIQFSSVCGGHHDVPVSGTILISLGGTTSEVDYGDGTCDKTFTITTNGESTSYELGRKGA